MQNKKIITIVKGALVWIFAVLVLGGLGSWFLLQEIKNEEAALLEAKNNYENTLEQSQSFDTVKKDFDNTKNLKEEVSGMLVKPDSVLGLIEELEKAAQLSQVTLKTSVGERPGRKNIFKPGQAGAATAANANSNQEIWLQLGVEGKFANILQFVRYLENAKKMVSVSSISINQSQFVASDFSGSKDESLGQLKADILVSNVF